MVTKRSYELFIIELRTLAGVTLLILKILKLQNLHFQFKHLVLESIPQKATCQLVKQKS